MGARDDAPNQNEKTNKPNENEGDVPHVFEGNFKRRQIQLGNPAAQRWGRIAEKKFNAEPP